jgi:hypothetical protein
MKWKKLFGDVSMSPDPAQQVRTLSLGREPSAAPSPQILIGLLSIVTDYLCRMMSRKHR